MNRSACAILAIVGFLGLGILAFWTYTISRDVRLTATLRDELKQTHDTLAEKLESQCQEATMRFKSELVSTTKESLRRQVDTELVSFQEELDTIVERRRQEERRYQELMENRQRLDNNLPEKVELDDLAKRYSTKLRQSQESYFAPVETFETEHGSISFMKSDFDLQFVPSTSKLAWIRIGKESSSLNAEIIKAWLDASIWAKTQQGYKKTEDEKKGTDYGQAHVKRYEKDDLYIKTYFQYARIQGTYGRHSLQYTFYIEIGSEERKLQARLEEYNEKTGS